MSVSSIPYNGVRYLRITDITENGELNDDKVSADISSGKTQEELQEGDILFASTGATVGKTLIYRKEFGKCLFAGYLIRYRLNKDIVIPQFIHHFTHSSGYYKWVSSNQKAAAQPNIGAKIYNELRIPVPPLSEQKEIVEYLDSSFAKIDKLKENAAKNLEEAKALFQSALKDALEPKEGWEEKTLKEICEKIFAGGDAPKNFTLEKNKTNNIPIFANAVKNDGLYGYTDKAVVTEPCVTIAARGSGTGFTLRRYTPFVPIVRLIVALPQREKISIDFLYYFLVKTNVSSSGSAIPQLTIPMIKAYRCVFPSISEQQSIVSFLDSLNEKVNTLQQNYSRICNECDAMKQAILRQVFE